MNNLSNCIKWYLSELIKSSNQNVSETRDVFQARLDKFFSELKKSKIRINDPDLLTAIVGEIGNNSFDHNLGQWKDIPGCWFSYEMTDECVCTCVCDRGNGILSTLQRVENLKDDQAAIEVAFQKRISGRAPEKRGNGLKFVKSVINEHETRGLYCRSGEGIFKTGSLKEEFNDIEKSFKNVFGKGVFTLIYWK